MKANIGVDADAGLMHTVSTAVANEADMEQVSDLLHGIETRCGQTGAIAARRMSIASHGLPADDETGGCDERSRPLSGSRSLSGLAEPC
ncbi:hypothetical protein ASC92_22850 [Variovorax sp. Root411]|nr:hypothetical protein ASC92_22850 [Variovorax sp. Root411]